MCACACATTHAPTPSRLVTQLTRTIALTCEAYAYGKGYAYNKGSAPVIPIIAPRPLLRSAFSFQVLPRKSSSSPTWQVRARKVSMQACASKGRQQGSSSTGEAFGGARGTHDEGPAVRGARHSKGKAQAGSSTGGRGGWRCGWRGRVEGRMEGRTRLRLRIFLWVSATGNIETTCSSSESSESAAPAAPKGPAALPRPPSPASPLSTSEQPCNGANAAPTWWIRGRARFRVEPGVGVLRVAN